MALMDKLFVFADAEDLFADGTTDPATNVLDMQDTDLEMGAGEPIYLNIRFTTLFAGGTSVSFSLVSDDDTTMDSNSVVALTTRVFAVADTTAGTWAYRGAIPYNFDDKQYVGVIATNVGTNTAGAADIWLDHGPQSSYDTQVTVSNI